MPLNWAGTHWVAKADGSMELRSGADTLLLSITAAGAISSPLNLGAAVTFANVTTTGRFTPPVLTGAERDALGTPTAGLVVYNTTTNKLNVYTGAGWEAVTSA